MSGTILFALRIILALSLYAFFGWALYTLWRDVQHQGSILASRKVPNIQISVDRQDNSPIVRHFALPEIFIGRDPNCQVTIDDDTVSARHSRLTYHHSQWWLEDLGSTNGTMLNQERIGTPTVVITGDEIGCGKATLTIALSAATQDSSTQRLPSEEEYGQ